MLKKFRKVTILALTLALILAASASAFAVTSWSHIWTASDEVTHVEYDCSIYSTGTDGGIYSQTNQGEVYAEVDAEYTLDNEHWMYTHWYDIGYEYAVVSVSFGGNAESANATYYFYAYVDTTGEEFESDAFTLILE